MNHRLLSCVCALLIFSGCDDSPALVDSGTDTVQADTGAADAGELPDSGMADTPVVAVDPTQVSWTRAEAPAAGPLMIWAPLTAALDVNSAFLFGGVAGGSTQDRDFIYRSQATTVEVTEIEGDGPPARYCGCAAFDSQRNVVVVAGGRNITSPLSITPDTWELDLESEVWTQVAVPETPGGIGCHLAYAGERGNMYLFGGAHMDGPSDKMFRYEPETPAWVEVAQESVRPSARYDGHFEPLEGDELLLFGGSFGATGAAFFSDVWKFDASTETFEEVTVTGPEPDGRRVPWATIREDRLGFYVAMGFDGAMEPMRDFWYFDLAASSWTELSLPDELSARSFTSWLPGPGGSLGLMLSGYDGDQALNEVWVLSPTE